MLEDDLGSHFSIHLHPLGTVICVQIHHTIVVLYKITPVSGFIPLNLFTHLTLFCSFMSMGSSYRASFFLVLIYSRIECTKYTPRTDVY